MLWHTLDKDNLSLSELLEQLLFLQETLDLAGYQLPAIYISHAVDAFRASCPELSSPEGASH